jgi:hypothetical protein
MLSNDANLGACVVEEIQARAENGGFVLPRELR